MAQFLSWTHLPHIFKDDDTHILHVFWMQFFPLAACLYFKGRPFFSWQQLFFLQCLHNLILPGTWPQFETSFVHSDVKKFPMSLAAGKHVNVIQDKFHRNFRMIKCLTKQREASQVGT